MKAVGKTNGTIPQWYRQIHNNLQTQQSEIFALMGDVGGYPVYPGETLGTSQVGRASFLERMTLGAIRKKNNSEEEVAQAHVFAELYQTTGLKMLPEHEEVFGRYSPPPDSNPFAQGGGLEADFGRLAQYFNDPAAPPLALIIHDADLIFDAEGALVEPERTLLAYLRQWSAMPLLSGNGSPHRIFLIAHSDLRGALVQGRIAPINIPLPEVDTRRDFVSRVMDANPNLTLEEGLTEEELARITGALNLLQLEDCLYQAELEGGIVSRKIVQARKDVLVRQTYGGVIDISYPEKGFDSIVGLDQLKDYFKNYVYPKMMAGDGRCPKGLVFSGNPGCGKTELSKALACALNLPLVMIRMDMIKNKFVGESNKNMSKLFEGIKALAPSIVLFDELHTMFNSGDSSGVSQEIQGQLQTFLAAFPRGVAFFIGTTNYPSRIPRELLRPGRFEQVIPLLPQHFDGVRHELIKVIADKMGIEMDVTEDELVELGEQATDFTGADVEQLCIEADREATEDGRSVIRITDLSKALEYVVPTAKSTQEMTDEALEYCSNRRFVPKAVEDKVGEPVKGRGLKKIEL